MDEKETTERFLLRCGVYLTEQRAKYGDDKLTEAEEMLQQALSIICEPMKAPSSSPTHSTEKEVA